LKTPSLLPATLLMLLILNAGCRRDMQDQPKYKPLVRSTFFTDGRSARPVPADTIARDELSNNDSFHTGEANGNFLDTIPVTVNLQLLHRGEDRYDIFCSPCHGRIGDGNGMIAQRGLRIPANLHTQRLREVPPGYLYQVITNGYGAMGEYSYQISVPDRWAIVAYLRALQFSRNARLSDVPAEAASELGAQR
jgi:mono/diheme cytochrome c family protein